MFSHFSRLCLCATLFCGLSTSAFAAQDQGTTYALDPVVVSARGVESTLSQTPGGVGVVDKEEIALSPKASIADALSRIPGVSKTGESPWGQDLNIRGMRGTSVVFLIDGKRINTATDINAQMGFINPSDIERIEVIKGPISALYGTGSTGGVINIITKKGHFSSTPEMHGELGGTWSSNPEGTDSYGRANYNSERFWLQLSGGTRDHMSYYGGENLMENSQFEDIQGRINGAFRWTDELTTEFQAMVLEGNDIGIPGGSKSMPANAPVTYPRIGSSLVSLDTTWTPKDGTLKELLASLYYSLNDRRVRIDNPMPPVLKITPNASHETVGGKIQGRWQLGEHQLVSGFDAWKWHMRSWRSKYLRNGHILEDQPTPNTTQLSLGLYAEDNWKLNEAWTLNLGARLDRVNMKNHETAQYEEGQSNDWGWNAHAGLTWDFAENWSQTFIAATSYRVPDIMDRFKNIKLGSATIKGNPDLDPEQSFFLEYGLHYKTGNLRLSGSLFHNLVSEYITEGATANPNAFQMENVGEAQIYGAELEAKWFFAPGWSTYATLAATHGEDRNEDEALRNIAPLNGLLGLRYENSTGFWARVETPWAAGQSDVPEGMETVDGYMLVNAAAGYDFDLWKLQHSVSLVLNNILDTRYENYLANSRGMELEEPGFCAAVTYAVSF